MVRARGETKAVCGRAATAGTRLRKRLLRQLRLAAAGLVLCGVGIGHAAVEPRVVGGGYHSLALADDGTLWSWGQNTYGQLGDGTVVDRRAPVQTGADFVAIAAGLQHSVGIKADGSLWAWGQNDRGQLGNGSGAAAQAPVRIGSDFAAVSAGRQHSLAVKSDGTLWAWGWNGYGQLGDGTTTDRNSPVQVGVGYVAVAAGDYHSLALGADGTLWSWGANNFAQLGDGGAVNRTRPFQVGTGYRAIAAGSGHSLGVQVDGTLSAWGSNSSGQLGDGTTGSSPVPKTVGTGFSSIAAGAYHSAALKPDGTLWAWGYNLYGQLGSGSTVDLRLPTQVGWDYVAVGAGGSHTLGVKGDGTVRAWGKSYEGQLGDGTRIDRWEPRLIGSGFRAIGAGANHSLAVDGNGSAWTWGQNSSGQLGDGTTVERRSPVSIGAGFVRLSGGTFHSAGIKTDGSLWAWGANSSGQLGDGTTTDRRTPKLIGSGLPSFASVSAGEYHTLALGTDGTVWGWGYNPYGQVGDGTNVLKKSPVFVASGFGYVDGGLYHSLAVGFDGGLWAWGDNVSGQLGDGTSVNRWTPIPTGTGFAQTAGGGQHTLGLKPDGTLWAWGYNGEGQLGDGTTTNRSRPVPIGEGYSSVAAGDSHSLALRTDGTLWAWGRNASGQLGDGSGLGRVLPVEIGSGFVAIAAGKDYTLALKTEGTLWAWGKNYYGQLGDGSRLFTPSPVQPLGVRLKDVPPAVTAAPKGGSYLSALEVTLSADEPALIYYTLDGTEPSASSRVYEAPIPVARTTTLRFLGEDEAGNRSPVQTETYTLGHSLTLTVAGDGAVHSSPGRDIDCGPAAVCSADYGELSILLTASPKPGFGFAGWTGCDTGTGPECAVTLTSDRTVSVTFVPDPVATGEAEPPEVVGSCAGPGKGTVLFRHGGSLGGDLFTWSFGDGTPDWSGSDRNAPVPHVYERPGTYAARLTVTDSRTGTAALQTLPVRALMGANAAPSVSPGGPYALRTGQSLSLEGSITDANLSCGDAVEARWFIPSDAAEPVAKTAAAVIPWSELSGRVLVNGTTSLRLSAMDALGAVGNATAALAVYDDTTRTTVASSSASAVYGQPVTFTASVVAADPRVSPSGTVQFQVDGIDFGAPTDLAGSRATLTTSSLPAGVHAIVARYGGDGTSRASSGLLPGGQTVTKAHAAISLGGLAALYDGSSKAVRADTTPPGLPVAITYDGSAGAPTNAGAYSIAARIVDENHEGSETGTLVVAKAAAALSLGALRQEWDGAAKAVSVTTTPAGLDGLSLTYDGATAPPTDAGRYSVRASLVHRNYAAEPAAATLTVVGLPFEGFFRPVDNPPVLNATKAGSSVPAKFSLKGDRGLQVLAAGYPRSVGVDCETNAPVEVLADTLAVSVSGLSYDPVTDQYTYVWKTDRYWSGCRQLSLKLVDGTVHTANFQFAR